MKILIVDLEHDYGNPKRGPNYIGRFGFLEPLKKLGHEVVTFYYDRYLSAPGDLQKDLIQKARQENPRIIYFNLFGEQFSFETLDLLKREFFTINWFGDDTWRFDSFTRRFAPHFSLSVTTDEFAVHKYVSLGARVFLSQWAAFDLDPGTLSASGGYEYDLSFVGASFSIRRWFIAQLEKRGLKVATFGFGWPSGPISLEEMCRIFRVSKINLNLSNSKSHDYRFLFSSPRHFYSSLRSGKTAGQVKARNFEIPYYGGFQITEFVPGLDKHLHLGKDVVCYKDIDEAELLIRHYLRNADEREMIKNQGIETCRSRHSYFHRHREILAGL